MVKKKGWVIHIPEGEYELREKVSRIQISDEPIEGMGTYHETENAYFKPLKEGFHYEWRCGGEYFKTFEEAKEYLLKKESNSEEIKTIYEGVLPKMIMVGGSGARAIGFRWEKDDAPPINDNAFIPFRDKKVRITIEEVK